MIVRWGSCIFVRVYLCMGWRGVCAVKVRVIDKLILGCIFRIDKLIFRLLFAVLSVWNIVSPFSSISCQLPAYLSI